MLPGARASAPESVPGGSSLRLELRGLLAASRERASTVPVPRVRRIAWLRARSRKEKRIANEQSAGLRMHAEQRVEAARASAERGTTWATSSLSSSERFVRVPCVAPTLLLCFKSFLGAGIERTDAGAPSMLYWLRILRTMARPSCACRRVDVNGSERTTAACGSREYSRRAAGTDGGSSCTRRVQRGGFPPCHRGNAGADVDGVWAAAARPARWWSRERSPRT
jgi:hypothetical protein